MTGLPAKHRLDRLIERVHALGENGAAELLVTLACETGTVPEILDRLERGLAAQASPCPLWKHYQIAVAFRGPNGI